MQTRARTRFFQCVCENLTTHIPKAGRSIAPSLHVRTYTRIFMHMWPGKRERERKVRLLTAALAGPCACVQVKPQNCQWLPRLGRKNPKALYYVQVVHSLHLSLFLKRNPVGNVYKKQGGGQVGRQTGNGRRYIRKVQPKKKKTGRRRSRGGVVGGAETIPKSPAGRVPLEFLLKRGREEE